jgi:predicted nucleotidyltransferase
VVYSALEEFAKEVVFVGGATVALYADRPATETRPTDDVDILVQVMHRKDYAVIEERLRSKGFTNDIESGVICRYKVKGIIVDVMPTGENTLGFSNSWYEEGYTTSVINTLEEGYPIRIFQAPYFLASKFEAFNNRGGGDGRFSPDFEDIIFVLNNRTTIWKEMQQADETVSNHLKVQFQKLMKNEFIEEWISSNLEPHEQPRIKTILREMKEFASIRKN